jgi:hypothetical protein
MLPAAFVATAARFIRVTKAERYAHTADVLPSTLNQLPSGPSTTGIACRSTSAATKMSTGLKCYERTQQSTSRQYATGCAAASLARLALVFIVFKSALQH